MKLSVTIKRFQKYFQIEIFQNMGSIADVLLDNGLTLALCKLLNSISENGNVDEENKQVTTFTSTNYSLKNLFFIEFIPFDWRGTNSDLCQVVFDFRGWTFSGFVFCCNLCLFISYFKSQLFLDHKNLFCK